MKKLFILLVFAGLAYADIAQSMLSLALSYAQKNPNAYKNALTSLNESVRNENLDEYNILAPKFLRNFISPNEDKMIKTRKNAYIKDLCDVISRHAKLSQNSIYEVLKNEIDSLDNDTISMSLNGEISMANFIKDKAFDRIQTALLPTAKACVRDSKFLSAYLGLTNATPSENELSKNFANEIFRILEQGENNFVSEIDIKEILLNLGK